MKHHKHHKHHEHKKHHRHAAQLIVFFLANSGKSKGKGRWTVATKILTTDKGLNLALVELRASDGKVFPLSAGPFAVDVRDPSNTVTVTPGSPDQTTPTSFVPAGGNTGTVVVNVIDQSNGLKGTGSFDVVAPTPPDQPDTLQVGFKPIT